MPQINASRLRRDLEELGIIGQTKEGGVNRPSFVKADREARDWFVGKLRDAGMKPWVDAAGNIFGKSKEGSPVVIMGSHLDSVPDGGRFDGALGVVAGLECLRVVAENNIKTKYPLEVAAFSDEEGRFLDFLGSFAFTGRLGTIPLETISDSQGVLLKDALADAGLDLARIHEARVDPASIRAYLELHIEQGPILHARRIPIGVIDIVRGILRCSFTFYGRADHSGTTPMDMRKDAFASAATFAHKSRNLAVRNADTTLTVGYVKITPGVQTIVPAEAQLVLDVRNRSNDVLEQLERELRALALESAKLRYTDVVYREIFKLAPVPLSVAAQAAIKTAAENLTLAYLHMNAGAGHDAMVIGRVAEAGMIFIPCIDGRSHCPDELATWEDVNRGANVLLWSALALAET